MKDLTACGASTRILSLARSDVAYGHVSPAVLLPCGHMAHAFCRPRTQLCHMAYACFMATWHVQWGKGGVFLFITQAGARRMRVRKSHSYPRRYFCMAVLSTSYFGLPKRVVDCTNFFMRQSRLSPWTVVKTAHKASFGEHGRNGHSSRDNCARARRSMSCEQFPQPRLVAPGPRWV